MITQSVKNITAKPFLKWAGGKTQLLSTIDFYLPKSFIDKKNITYIEPFVGGGAVLFYLLRKYPNIKKAVINDINKHLITTYKVIRDNPYFLIDFLSDLESRFKSLSEHKTQKEFFINIRSIFNNETLTDIEEAAYMIFLNRTCFNGLYRENSNGVFNVPFGRYSNPKICDSSLIITDSELLQKVEILCDDFSQTEKYIDGYTFFYFDPPYRPIDATSSFTSYVSENFNDNEQIRLRNFYSLLSENGYHVLLSNSDGKNRSEKNTFLDDLYRDFMIERVTAKRSINSNPSKRGILTELLIRNYSKIQGNK